jgi:hypothetical protein
VFCIVYLYIHSIMNAYNVNIYTDDGTIRETIGFSEDTSLVDTSLVDTSLVDTSLVDMSLVDMSLVDMSLKTSKYHIHKDDSIMQIKNKILLLYPEISYDEIYVFAKARHHVNLSLVYQNIAKTSSKIGRKNKKTLETAGLLDKKQYKQLLINLGKNVGDLSKEYYDYGDLVQACDSPAFDASIGVGLGMHFSKYHNFLFSANPFELVENHTPNLLEDKTNTIYFFDNELLFNNGNVEAIGVVFAEDAFSFAKRHGISEEYISKTYFPGLASKNVFTTAQLDKAAKPPSISERTFETVDEFYKMNRLSQLKFDQKGVRKFKFALKPDYDTLIPLDAIFKNIHACEATPFIKYNPGVRRDNICRIYSTEITRTGKKIPVLPHNKITHLANTIGKHKQISIYENTHELTIDVEDNGVVYISGEFSRSVSIDDMETMIRSPVNDVLNKINGYLQNSGYMVPVIGGLRDDNVDFLTLDYVASISIKNLTMKLKTKIGCLSSIFDIIDDSVNKGAVMRFKRVENFQEMDAQSATITEVFRSSRNEEDVIAALMQNYNITIEEAAVRISEYLKNVKYIERSHGSKSIEIVENPGLTVFLQYDTRSNKMVIRVDKLPHIEYIETLSLYFSGLIKLYIDDESVSEKMKDTCNKKIEKAKPNIATVVQHVDQIEEQKAKPKAFNIFDFVPAQKQPSNVEEEEEDISPKPGSPKLSSPKPGQSLILEDDSSIGSDEEFFGIEQLGGGPKAKAKSSDDEDAAQNNNYFLERLQERDPALFLKKREGKFKVYSRACQAVHQKQPVVLSDEEKAKIDDDDKKAGVKSYNKAIKYGTSEDDGKKNWYICPRFWCFNTNTSMTKEQIDAGKCGTNYHEFTEDVYHYEKGKYVDFSPGFLNEAHPKYCVPCCFSRWNSELHKKRRKQCVREDKHIFNNDKDEGEESKDESKSKDLVEDSSEDSEEEEKAKPKRKPRAPRKVKIQPSEAKNYDPDYIEDGNILPLKKGSWALAQKAVQHFMQIDYSENVLEIGRKGHKSAYVKENKQTFLRHGVEQDEKTYKNSILGCLANVYSGDGASVSVDEFINKLTSSITIDDFVKYGNGTYQSVFRPKNPISVDDVNIDTHLDSDLYASYKKKYKDGIVLTNINHLNVFVKIVAAYDNFIRFLKDPESDIDHTYIWDVVSTLNTKIFPKGLNLVIMEVVNNDITHNIDVLCPSSAYSKNLFDENKPTLFLAKQDRLFEPIYGYKYQGSNLKITRTFTMDEPVASNIKNILDMMNNTINGVCKPKQSLPTKYVFASPILLSRLEEELNKLNPLYTIRGQIMNFQGKIIALTVKKRGVEEEIYVPSHPSSPLPTYPIIMMDEPSLWTTYPNTRKMLRDLSEASNGTIPCKTKMKIIEDGSIVGVLTETNQYIQVTPEPKTLYDQETGIISIEEKNYMMKNKYAQIEKEITTSIKEDSARVKAVQSVNIENDFYSVFRSTLKTLIISSNVVRNKVIEVILDRTSKYRHRLDILIRLFKRIMDGSRVEFSTDDDLDRYSDFIKAPYVCRDGKRAPVFSADCKLVISKQNMINTTVDNSVEYYYRVADETLRYGKIQQFMIYPKQFLNIAGTEYKIAADEFIILEKFLFARNYFADMKPYLFGEHVQQLPFSVANPDPKIAQVYSNSVSLEEQRAFGKTDLMENVNRCKKKMDTIAGEKNYTNYWQNAVFKKGTKLIIFKDDTPECSFGAIYYILQDLYKRPVSSIEIRKMVWDGYAELWKTPKYQKIILIIFNKQGKGKMVASGAFSDAMTNSDTMPENYFITVLDMWVIAQKFNIPIIMCSPYTTLKQTGIVFVEKEKETAMTSSIKNPLRDPNPHRLTNSWIVMGRTPRITSDKFYFVMAPSKEITETKKDTISEISMIYGSFVIDDLGTTPKDNNLGPKIRDALNGGSDYGARARPITEFFDEIAIVKIPVPKKE